MKKLRIALLAIVAVVTALVTTALFVEFDAPGLGRRILEAAGNNAGISLQASGFRLHLRHGIVLYNVVAITEIPSGTVVATVDRVVLEHRLWPLLFGDIVIDRLLMEQPTIEVRNAGARAGTASGPPAFSRLGSPRGVRLVPASLPRERPAPARLSAHPASGAAIGRGVVVHAASIIDGTLVVLAPDGTATTTATGLDAEVTDIQVDARAASVAVGLTGHGHIDVAEVRFAERVATGSRARLVAADGVYTVSGLVLTAAEGKIGLDQLVIDVRRNPYVYRTSLTGDDLDLNRILGVDSPDSLGPARFEMDAAGAGPETSSITGSGRIILSQGTIPEVDALDRVAEMLGLHLGGLHYEAATIDFTLGDDRIEIAPFEIVAEAVLLRAAGNVSSQGALTGRATVLVPRDDLDLGNWQGDLSDGIVDALTDDSGWVSIPLLIGGTVDQPRAAPDYDALLAALQRSAGPGLGKWLQGIIKRDG